MKTKPLLCLPLLLLCGCLSKENDNLSKYCPGSCTVISGRLTTDNGSMPLAGVKLDVKWEWRATFGLGFNKERRKATATTDADGKYELRFLLRDDELDRNTGGYISVTVPIDESKYLPLAFGDNFLFDDTLRPKRDTTYVVNYTFPKKAFVEVTFRNTQAIQQGERLLLQSEYVGGQDNRESFGSNAAVFEDDTSTKATLPVAAGQQVVLRTLKTKAGAETVTADTVVLEPGQQLPYEVTF